MAIQIKAPLTTSEGIELNSVFGFLRVTSDKQNFTNVDYYASKEAFDSGKLPFKLVYFEGMPINDSFHYDLPASVFWSDVMLQIHLKIVENIESLTGTGTVEIIELS